MATPHTRFCCGCKTIFLMLVILVLVLAISAVAINSVLNKTIDELGYADYEIMGTTPAELGLADTTIWEFIKTISALNNPDINDFVTKPYDADDIAEVDTIFADSVTNYSSLATQKVYLSDEYITLKDSNLAYILDSAVNSSEEISFSVEVAEVSIYKLNGSYVMRLVTCADIEIDSDNSILNSLFPDALYFVSTFDMDYDDAGALILTHSSLTINGIDSEGILNLLLASIVDDDSQDDGCTIYNNQLGAAISTVVSNIGSISTDNGNSGISDSKLYLKTH